MQTYVYRFLVLSRLKCERTELKMFLGEKELREKIKELIRYRRNGLKKITGYFCDIFVLIVQFTDILSGLFSWRVFTS